MSPESYTIMPGSPPAVVCRHLKLSTAILHPALNRDKLMCSWHVSFSLQNIPYLCFVRNKDYANYTFVLIYAQ
jgi:hypothetical protein